MEENREVIKKFMGLTGVDEGRAKFFLEASGYNLDLAVSTFFEEKEQNADSDDPVEVPASEDEASAPKTKSGGKPAQPSRFGTVAGLVQDSSSDDEDSGQAFYAGGSQHSGQQVLGPPRSRNRIVAEMFRSVRQQGAEVVDQPGSTSRNTLSFTGTGYRLGQTEQDSTVIASRGSGERDEVTVTLKMWRSGFTVDDGPIRPYNDQENMKFLRTVGRGVIPEELLREARGSEVNLNMEDHSEEDYAECKPKLKVFSGKGNVLGSPVPNVSTTPAPTATSQVADVATAESAVAVDQTQPTTKVQIRMADGSRLIATLNHTHTVADIRTFIISARPDYGTQAFRLLTSFPSKELTDPSATLSSAGLLNATVMQRLG